MKGRYKIRGNKRDINAQMTVDRFLPHLQLMINHSLTIYIMKLIKKVKTKEFP